MDGCGSADAVDITPTMVDNMMKMRKNLEGVLDGYKEYISKHVLQTSRDLDACNDINTVTNLETTIMKLQDGCYLVQKNDLERIFTEVKQLKDSLPKIVNKDLIQAPYKLHLQEIELKSLRLEKKELEQTVEGLKSRQEAILTELDREKQSNLMLKQGVQEYREISAEQASYCAKLGAITCNLLWKASDHDGTILKMISGEYGEQFLELANFTLNSYLLIIQEESEMKHAEMEREHCFMFMLIGFITNISASAAGREFLVSHKCSTILFDTLISINATLPLNRMRCVKLRNLILKVIYNISINEKGFSYLCSKKSLFKTLASIIEEEKSSDNRLQATRIIHSVVLEPNSTEVHNDILDVLPIQKIQKLIVSARAGELQKELKDLAADIQSIGTEP